MNLNATRFNPGWPATCPWVTIVGGTQVKANASVAEPHAEEVWNQDLTMGFFLSGGGGFSNRFPIPKYQEKTVKSYLQQQKKTDSTLLKHFNPAGVCFKAKLTFFMGVDHGCWHSVHILISVPLREFQLFDTAG